MVKLNKESKHQLSYSGRVKALCLQKNTALWIGTGGGHILLLDLSTRRVIRTIHNFCDSVRAMATAQLGKFLSLDKSILVLFFVFVFVFDFSRQGLYIALAVLELNFVDLAGLELRNPPASASRVLGLKVCATTPS
jgi:hypothetical protein